MFVPLTVAGDTAIIHLSGGRRCLVDARDWEVLTWMTWTPDVRRHGVYVKSQIRIDGELRGTVYLHRLVACAAEGMDVDHINRDTLDNRLRNLRVCTRAQNLRNSGSKGGTSRYKGVSWSSRAKRWIAQLVVGRKHKHVGTFSEEEAAARAYDEAAKREFGAFAKLNFDLPAVHAS